MQIAALSKGLLSAMGENIEATGMSGRYRMFLPNPCHDCEDRSLKLQRPTVRACLKQNRLTAKYRFCLLGLKASATAKYSQISQNIAKVH